MKRFALWVMFTAGLAAVLASPVVAFALLSTEDPTHPWRYGPAAGPAMAVIGWCVAVRTHLHIVKGSR